MSETRGRGISLHLLLPGLVFFSFAIATTAADGDHNVFKDAFNLTASLEAIDNARESIIDVTKVFRKANNTNMAAKFLRLAFHDAIGGPDGCVDLSHKDNFGLEIPIDALKPIVAKYSSSETGLSRADIWALSAVTGVEISQVSSTPYEFPLQYIGRVDCDAAPGLVCRDAQLEPVECSYDKGPHRPAPSAHLDTLSLLHFFSTIFGFSPRQTVVIMGAHTLGFAKREHSGFDGPKGWVRDPDKLNNEYYRMLVGQGNCVEEYVDFAPNWSRNTMKNEDIVLEDKDNTTFSNQFFWSRRSDDSSNVDGDSATQNLMMTTSDIALVRDFTGYRDNKSNNIKCNFIFGDACPYSSITGELMAEYRRDSKLWIRDFRETFNLMITRGYDTTNGGVVPLDCTNCLMQVDFTLSSRPSMTPTTKLSESPSESPSLSPFTIAIQSVPSSSTYRGVGFIAFTTIGCCFFSFF